MLSTSDINKYIGIGEVGDHPKAKYVTKTESYLIEFDFRMKVSDPADLSNSITEVIHPVVVRRERLALYLKDVLKKGMRVYLEGALVPYQIKTKTGEIIQSYRIEANDILLIDAADKPKYPDDIKKIKRS